MDYIVLLPLVLFLVFVGFYISKRNKRPSGTGGAGGAVKPGQEFQSRFSPEPPLFNQAVIDQVVAAGETLSTTDQNQFTQEDLDKITRVLAGNKDMHQVKDDVVAGLQKSINESVIKNIAERGHDVEPVQRDEHSSPKEKKDKAVPVPGRKSKPAAKRTKKE